MMSEEVRHVFWKYVLIGGCVITALYFTLPNVWAMDAVYSAVGIGSFLCVVFAKRWFHPRDQFAWTCLAATALLNTLGDNIGYVYNLGFHEPTPFPGFDDASYLLAYPFLMVGIHRLARQSKHSARREDYIDATIVTLGILALVWHFLMSSYLHEGGVTLGGRLTLLAYPLLDVAVIFILCRALIFNPQKRPYEYFLTASMVIMASADFYFDYLVLHNHYATGNPSDALFLLQYVAFGVAALHPSMGLGAVPPSEHSSEDQVDIQSLAQPWKVRMPIVALTGFIPPALLLVASLFDVHVDIPVLATLSVIVLALVLLRVTGLIRRLSIQAVQLETQYLELKRSHDERDMLEHDLRHQAFHDRLTGLANRALLHDRLSHALASTARTGRAVALLVGDLDGFKTLNDTQGHEAGDAALVKVAEILANAVRPSDTVARPGGDEFAILMDEIDDPRAIIDMAQRVVRAIKQAAESDQSMTGISMSAGIAVGDSSITMDQLIAEADAAMYLAKANGKNRVQIFQPSMRAKLMERAELSNSFFGALERAEFFLDFQPIFSLSTGELSTFEALVRWNHPRFGLLSPTTFLPVAEETGFIVPLGRWIMRSAIEHLAVWDSITDTPLKLAVNLSKRQLNTPGLVDDVRSAIAIAGARSDRLVVEVNESVLMSHTEQTDVALSALRNEQVQVAVDNFGTGYSALRYLEHSPVDLIKIDKSFVDTLSSGGKDRTALVGTMIGLAHSLDLSLVAEGIEEQEQLTRLVELGCEEGQGYLMQRPFDPYSAIELIRERAPASSPVARLVDLNGMPFRSVTTTPKARPDAQAVPSVIVEPPVKPLAEATPVPVPSAF